MKRSKGIFDQGLVVSGGPLKKYYPHLYSWKSADHHFLHLMCEAASKKGLEFLDKNREAGIKLRLTLQVEEEKKS